MFTGIITAQSRVQDRSETPAGARLVLENPGYETSVGMPAGPGESIAVNGVCLTILESPAPNPDLLHVDIVKETLNRTTLQELDTDSLVHIEHAATASTLMSGHLVQGHVDAIGTVHAISTDSADWRLTLKVTPEALRLIAPKGSITVDGVSLTVAQVNHDERTFEIALIPTTLERTHLDALSVGDRVNLETDVIARQVANYLENMGTLSS